jgi:sugar O-acyltransferase, sialic acid O-acetyltransferase NeuD family
MPTGSLSSQSQPAENEHREDVLVWGAAGHAKVVADILRQNGYTICGFLDETTPDRHGESFCGATVLGDANQLEKIYESGVRKAIAAFGNNMRRLAVGELLEEQGFDLITAIHPSAVIAADALIGPGSVVAAGAVVGPGAVIGRCAIVNTAATVDHDCTIADGVHIGPGAHIAGHVQVGRCAWIGIGVTIINRKRIGASSIVGAGAAVIEDVPDRILVAGVPARVIKSVKET